MIPVAGAVRVGHWPVRGFRLPIPFLLLWLLFLPLLALHCAGAVYRGLFRRPQPVYGGRRGAGITGFAARNSG